MIRYLLGSLLFVGTAHAQMSESPRGMAMSGVRADPVGSSAIIYNPAGMSRSYLYAAEMIYHRRAPGDLNAVGLNVVDSKTQPNLAVGLSYAFQFADKKADLSQSGHDARLAFAHPAIPEKLNLGLSLRYLQIERKAEGVPNQDLDGFTLDTGLLFSATPEFHIGIVAHNLVDLDDRALPRQLGGGLAYTGKDVTLDVDVMMDFNTHEDGAKPVVSAGLELLLGGSVPTRAGYVHDAALEQQWISGGLGFMTGEGKNGGQMSISYRHNVTEDEHYAFALGLTIFI